MPIFKLSSEQINNFDTEPEIGMGYHLAIHDNVIYFIIGGLIALPIDNSIKSLLIDYLDQNFVKPNLSFAERIQSFEDWLAPMPSNTSLSFYAPGGGSAGIFTFPPLPLPPAFLLPVFGQCLFSTTTSADAVFYRYEHFPVSRRVHLSTHAHHPNTVSTNTFGCPASEAQHISSGFGAVARFALPSLFPAIFRYEIQPNPGAIIRCGASVPLYGQSGGGVEVVFPTGCTNRGAIANPIYLHPI